MKFLFLGKYSNTGLAGFLKNPTGYGLVKSQFEALLAFKTDVQRFEEVFAVLDEDSNGRIDALEFIAAVAQCCKGTFEAKSRFCFENLPGNFFQILAIVNFIPVAFFVFHSPRVTSATVISRTRTAP